VRGLLEGYLGRKRKCSPVPLSEGGIGGDWNDRFPRHRGKAILPLSCNENGLRLSGKPGLQKGGSFYGS